VLFNDSQVTEASLRGEDPQFGTKLTSKLVSLLPSYSNHEDPADKTADNHDPIKPAKAH